MGSTNRGIKGEILRAEVRQKLPRCLQSPRAELLVLFDDIMAPALAGNPGVCGGRPVDDLCVGVLSKVCSQNIRKRCDKCGIMTHTDISYRR